MSSAATLLKFAAMFFLFLVALSSAIELATTTKQIIDNTDAVIYGTDRNLTQVTKIMGEYTVSGAEVLQSIFHIQEIGADIQVDSYDFPKDMNIEQADVSMIHLNRQYAATYARNAEGALSRVMFQIR